MMDVSDARQLQLGTLLGFVPGRVNQELLLQNEQLAAENRILRAHFPNYGSTCGQSPNPGRVAAPANPRIHINLKHRPSHEGFNYFFDHMRESTGE